MSDSRRPIVFDSVDDAFSAMTTAFNEGRFGAAHFLARRLMLTASKNRRALRLEQWVIVAAVLDATRPKEPLE